MGNKVTLEERELIRDLLKEGYTPKGAAMLVGRGERTGFYVQAEMRREAETRRAQPKTRRFTDMLRGVFNARKETDSGRGGSPWWAKE
jgi:hypothetical protein